MEKKQQTSERWYPNMFYFNIKKNTGPSKISVMLKLCRWANRSRL